MSAVAAGEVEELLAAAREAAREGAAMAMSWRRNLAALEVEEKAASDDLVSQADRDTERAIRAVLGRLRPADGVLGEEDGETAGASGIRWLVDPIDGTTNYLYGRADWAVSIAAVSRDDSRTLAGVVVEPALDRLSEATAGGGAWSGGSRLRCNPATDLSRALIELNLGRGPQKALAKDLIGELLPRVRDVRRGGSAAAALAQVADGRADAYWGPGLRPWDGAAGALLVSEAGGSVGDLAGRTVGRWPASGDILAAPTGLWEPLRALLAGIYGETRAVTSPGRAAARRRVRAASRRG
jgi:myo-inositol-1(or 4)-monophosphatase